MAQILEVSIPLFPECWSGCGNCGQAGVTVEDILVAAGGRVERDETLFILETGKVALDIPSPCAGEVVAVLINVGDKVVETQVVILLEI